MDKSGYLFLNKEMIDKACGDTKHLKYDKNFSMKIFMTKVDDFKMTTRELKRDAKKSKDPPKTAEGLEEF